MDADPPDITVLTVIEFKSPEDQSVAGGVILSQAVPVLSTGRLALDAGLVRAAGFPQDAS
ncbi:MAG: hypothetical protein ACRDPO_16885 [Streptosporangiaceae bacterium]